MADGTADPLRVYYELCRARAANEEPLGHPSDITDVVSLIPLKGRAVKFTRDDGESWRIGVIVRAPQHFNDGSYGCLVDLEIGALDVHGNTELTDRRFARGLVVRPATGQDIAGLAFSYRTVPTEP